MDCEYTLVFVPITASSSDGAVFLLVSGQIFGILILDFWSRILEGTPVAQAFKIDAWGGDPWPMPAGALGARPRVDPATAAAEAELHVLR